MRRWGDGEEGEEGEEEPLRWLRFPDNHASGDLKRGKREEIFTAKW
jgi:hypothetical protein